jgi:hypothetical protein
VRLLLLQVAYARQLRLLPPRPRRERAAEP